jgi:GT2 family glycosyltransferase
MTQAEVIVVGSDDWGLITEDDGVRFIANPQSTGGAIDRNLGMQAARGDIFLFLDHDCLPAPDWVERHLYRHDCGEQIVGGAVTLHNRNYLQLADNVSAYHDLLPFTREGVRPYLSTANLSVRRSVVERVGEMRSHFRRAEDLEWTTRFRALGYALYFDPRAIVEHDPARCTWSTVWRHWTTDAHDTLSVRLRYASLLHTPRLAKYRSIYLWGAPMVAAWATARTFAHHQIIKRYWYTLPLVFVTKLAWCWGAFRHFPDLQKSGTPIVAGA